MAPEELRATIASFFADNCTLSLATSDELGRPYAANVYVVADERLRLYFLSDPITRHGGHIAARPHVAATAYGATDSPSGIHGVQLRGRAAQCDPLAFSRDWSRFEARFTWAAVYRERAERSRFYCVEPTWLRWIDNRRSFGFACERSWSVTGEQ